MLACSLPAACADPCLDDGLGQSGASNCPTLADATNTEGATESNSNSNTMTDTMASATMGSNSNSNSESMSGSQTGEGTLDDTTGGTLWCADADGDGFGDPDMCTQSDEMPPGTVDNDDDCDDTNPNTFPGAAELDDPRACMNDDDDDGWGDDGMGGDDLPPGVEPGNDCDDENPNTFPGAAENEDPPDQCMQDEDGDGWGDADPGGGGGGGGDRGPASGSDCYDANPLLNPDTVRLTAFLPFDAGPGAPRNIVFVNLDASFDPFVQLLTPMSGVPNVNIVTATFNEGMQVFANDLESVELHTVDYAKTCGGAFTGVIEPVSGVPYGPQGDIVCGLEFGNDGELYGIGHTGDDLRTFDTATGDVIDSLPITIDGGLLDVFSCGMARDCASDRLLLANGVDRAIYGIEPSTGDATLLRDLSAFFPSTWNPTGLEYEPTTHSVLLSTGTDLYRVNLEDDSDPEPLGGFGTQVSNLQNLPICMQ
jgi:hypothetical protein